MSDKQKKEYISPKIEVHIIEMEQGIATGSASAKINPGDTDTPYTPEIKDWESGWDTDSDFDL